MQCYTELLAPSGVTQALSLPFTSSSSTNLVVGKTSLLQIFSLVNVGHDSKFNLIAEYHLSGTITALGRVKILNSRSGGEVVIVALRDAKLSLVEWDPDSHNISTISIHYYESEDLQRPPWAPDISQCVNRLTVDPSSRCAAFNFGVSNLAILPFHQAGDDLVMDDYDPDLDGERPASTSHTTTTNGDSSIYKTPYASSFVLPLSALDPGLVYPISIAFLHEYREPTFGILYSQVALSNGLLYERKDVVAYAVFTLDLEQRASTTLLSVARMPNDLRKVIPLPPPVGGALLVGDNELIHVDQGGKTNAVGINEFSRQASSFSMADQSDCAMRLENCVVEDLGMDNNDLFLILANGELAILSFKLDGRTVSGLSVRKLPFDTEDSFLKASPSCSTPLGRNRFFVGSEEADSILASWSRRAGQLKRQRSQAGIATSANGAAFEDGDEDEMDDYEDDLYGTAEDAAPIPRSQSADASATADYTFRIQDTMPNVAPIKDMVLSRPGGLQNAEGVESKLEQDQLEVLVASGARRAGGAAMFKRQVDPLIVRSSQISGIGSVWSVSVTDRTEPGSEGAGSQEDLDRFLIVSRKNPSAEDESAVYVVTSKHLRELEGTDFDSTAGATVEVGSLAKNTRAIQVLKNELRSYDSSFGLSQIYPMMDEATGEEPKVISASFADPYLLIIRDNQSVLILEADENGDIDEVERSDPLMSPKWACGSLYRDHSDTFDNGVVMFLVTTENCLQIFSLSNLNQPIFTAQGVNLLPTSLPSEQVSRRGATREPVTEIVVADLGDAVAKSPYLIARTRTDEIALYEPFRETSTDRICFTKVPDCYLDKVPSDQVLEVDELDQDQRQAPLRVLPNVGGYSAVFLPGLSPTFIMKSRFSSPHLHPFRGRRVKAFGAFNSADCPAGFIYVDANENLNMSQLEQKTRYGEGRLLSRKVELGYDVSCVSYFASTGSYVLGASHQTGFKLPEDDEWHAEWRDEEITFLPQLDQGSIQVVDPKTSKVIDKYLLDTAERPLCIEAINLETSEEAHERKELVVVGTATTKGEDVSARGSIYIFDIVDVVPEPDRPETHLKLKLIAKEDVKGAVTALSPIGSQGFLLAAQGQKCMVRGLKEDQTILPVAFMDMRYYVKVAKELKGTGLTILADAMNGLWFVGYAEEPYKLTLMGKASIGLEVTAADFLPDGKQLYIVAADGNCDLHILQYDPEHPKSLRGSRLLHRSTFQTGYFATSLTLLPRTPVSSEIAGTASDDEMDVDTSFAEHQLLMTTQEGAVALITPLSEQQYRRLSTLQNQLINTLEHPCSLNPRAYRCVDADGIGGRGMIDGQILLRWFSLSSQRKAEISGRADAATWEIRGDLEAIGGSGLGYL